MLTLLFLCGTFFVGLTIYITLLSAQRRASRNEKKEKLNQERGFFQSVLPFSHWMPKNDGRTRRRVPVVGFTKAQREETFNKLAKQLFPDGWQPTHFHDEGWFNSFAIFKRPLDGSNGGAAQELVRTSKASRGHPFAIGAFVAVVTMTILAGLLDGPKNEPRQQRHSQNREVASTKLELLERDCQGQKNLAACYDLAIQYGELGRKDEMIRLYEDGCKKQDWPSCTALGIQKEELGSRQDAKDLYQKACDGQDEHGCVNLATKLKGEGNLIAAERVYRKACNQKQKLGCLHLGMIHSERGVKKKAIKLWEEACAAGYPLGCTSIGEHYLSVGLRKKAAHFFRRACKEKEQIACGALNQLDH